MRYRDEPSPRELAALRAIVEHGTIAAAARALRVSPHTVDAHLDSLGARWRLRYLPQLVAHAALAAHLARPPEAGPTPIPAEAAAPVGSRS